MKTKATPIIAIIVIGALTAYALYQNVDGVLLAASMTIIAGLGGYTISNLHKK